MISDNAGFAAIYDHANLATKLQRGAVINTFIYGANNAKARQTGTDGSKVYLGGYEDWITANQTKVSLGNYAQVTNGTGGRVLHYFLTDRLGSVDAVTDQNGTLVETRGYDAYGAPRTGTWADATQIQSTAITPKGFTGHEHLNSVQLIHMNGRMYDYQLGRFLGVDPFIQAPTNSQSMNPYFYLNGNPLSGTDPTGYAICDDAQCSGKEGIEKQEPAAPVKYKGSREQPKSAVEGHYSSKNSSSAKAGGNGVHLSAGVEAAAEKANGAVSQTSQGRENNSGREGETLVSGTNETTQLPENMYKRRLNEIINNLPKAIEIARDAIALDCASRAQDCANDSSDISAFNLRGVDKTDQVVKYSLDSSGDFIVEAYADSKVIMMVLPGLAANDKTTAERLAKVMLHEFGHLTISGQKAKTDFSGLPLAERQRQIKLGHDALDYEKHATNYSNRLFNAWKQKEKNK